MSRATGKISNIETFWDRNKKSGGYLLRKSIKSKGYNMIRFLLLFGIGFLILQPIFNKISITNVQDL